MRGGSGLPKLRSLADRSNHFLRSGGGIWMLLARFLGHGLEAEILLSVSTRIIGFRLAFVVQCGQFSLQVNLFAFQPGKFSHGFSDCGGRQVGGPQVLGDE